MPIKTTRLFNHSKEVQVNLYTDELEFQLSYSTVYLYLRTNGTLHYAELKVFDDFEFCVLTRTIFNTANRG